MAVLKALENCISKEKFIEKMKQFGWSAKLDRENGSTSHFRTRMGRKCVTAICQKHSIWISARRGWRRSSWKKKENDCRNVYRNWTELINDEKEILMKKNVPVEQMLKYLGYEKLTREMLEEYVQGIYVYDDGRVEVEWKE